MNSTGYPSVNHPHSTISPPEEHGTDLPGEPYLTATSYCTPKINLTEVLSSSGPEEFKPTEGLVITALNDYLLEDFIVPHDHLTIRESLYFYLLLSGISYLFLRICTQSSSKSAQLFPY